MKKLLTALAAACGLAASTFAATINLANVTADTTLNNGDVAYGTLSRSVKISIAAGATVTISNATINIGGDDPTIKWAGLTCIGSATIMLKGNNTVRGFHPGYPGIYVPEAYTLTIQGSGSLTAYGGAGDAAGIGSGSRINCGNIVIAGGSITAYGGSGGAGIGASYSSICGNITISGGTVTAYPDPAGASIGSGKYGACGNITISGGRIYAYGRRSNDNSGVGIGSGLNGICGSIVILGGDVRAYGEGPHVGIGCYERSSCGGVFVWGGRVYAESGDSRVAAIGASTPNCSCGPVIVGDDMDDQTIVRSRTITSKVVNLADVTEATSVADGKILTGTLAANVKVSIADGATVTLRDVTINGVNDMVNCAWAGLTCEGDATIILEGNNTVKGFYENYPGIYVPEGYTLTIKGDGSLYASSNGYGAGIGGGWNYINCGNIRIEGGTIIAMGSYNTPGIGSGSGCRCGDITITRAVASVTATKGSGAPYSIGASSGGSVGTVTIGGVVTGSIAESPYTYVPTRVNLAAQTGDYTASDGDVMYGETTHTVTVPAGVNVMINGVEVVGVHDVVLDLGDVNSNTTIADGAVVTGTLSANVKVSIADGAAVTLRDATINGVNDQSYEWAGITCKGDATIKLEGSNTVKGFYENYPGIYVPANKTLTINGSGVLNASSNGYAPGIGGAYNLSCGNIRIEGGKINAKGGRFSAGIGGGAYGDCGDITITEGATSVTAEKGAAGDFSIGRGNDDRSCGTVTIGGVVGEISQNPYTYYGILPAPAFAADGKAATTEFVKGENGKWTLTTFAEMSNDALGSGVANGQIKVYAAPTVEGLNNASPMTSGVTVKGKKSAVMTTIEVTPPGNPDSQFFKVKFGE